MPMYRYDIINLVRQAYKRGELELPKGLKFLCINRKLLSYAERGENSTQQIITAKGSGNFPQSLLGMA